MSLKKGEDFIDQISSFISSTTMTSIRWAECIATSMLSTIMGPDRYISSNKGKLPLNVWYMCVGPSGLGHKTLPMKVYLIPILIETSERLTDKYPLVLPSRFSVEGLINYMSKRSMGSIVRDEFTGLFKEAYNKDYLADSLEFLSELYDGIVQKRTTISHKTQDVRKVYITFITASTPYLYKVMRADFYTQGTGNRIMIELFNADDLSEDRINSKDFFRGPIFEARRENFISDIADTLSEMRHCNVQYFIPDENAAEVWSQFEYRCRMIAKERFRNNTYDLHYSYISRSAEMVLKLSSLYAFSRAWDRVILDDAPPELIVLDVDMKRAIDKAQHHYNEFKRMLDQWRIRPEPVLARTYEEQASYIMDALYEHVDGVNWTELRKSAKWDTRTWFEVLKYLYESEKIVIVQAESTGGRRPIKFFENKSSIEVKGTRLGDWRIVQGILNL